MTKLRATICVLITLAVGKNSQAYVGSISIEELVRQSTVIVLAKVESVTPSRIRVARATVLSVWKGPATLQEAEFVASPTWMCDIADAKVGETAVLFLGKDSQRAAFVIMHAGRGRMPIEDKREGQFAAIWPDVRFHQGTQTKPGPEPEYDFIRSISVSHLENIVRQRVAKPTHGSFGP